MKNKPVHIHRDVPLPPGVLILFLSPQLRTFAKGEFEMQFLRLRCHAGGCKISHDIKNRASKGLAGFGGPNWLNIVEVMPALQVQTKMQV